jgi:hypothetical protein
MGGLGNQLFQIFATIAYTFKNKHEFIFPYSYELRANTTRYTYWETFLNGLKRYTTDNPEYNITNDTLNSWHTVHMMQHHYEEIPSFINTHNFRIHGYFQSYKYFENVKERIYDMIHLNDAVAEVREENRNLLEDGKYKISMHFRMGDYKHIQYCHNILPYDYYRNALSIATQDLPNMMKIKVLIFCEAEDNDSVMSMVNDMKNIWPSIEFVKVDDRMVDWKQMLLMSLCDSNIIANSSFSWWGAYMNNNTNKNKMVCYPSKWFGPTLQHNYIGDMFPPDWHKIEVN